MLFTFEPIFVNQKLLDYIQIEEHILNKNKK